MKTKLLGTLGVLGAFFMTTSMTAKTTNTDSKPSNGTTITFTAGTDVTTESSIIKDNVHVTDSASQQAFNKNPYVFGSTEFGDSLSIYNDHDSITKISIYSSDDSAANFSVSSFATSTYSFNGETHIGTIDFSGEEGGGTYGCMFLNSSGLNINVETISVTIKKDETPTFTEAKSIGGYRIDEGSKNKIQILGFGFTVNASVLPGVYTEYGVEVYAEESCETFVTYRGGTDFNALKAKEGRYYAIFDCIGGSEPKPDTTYYARGYLKSPNESGGSKYTYSSVISAKGNSTTQYAI